MKKVRTAGGIAVHDGKLLLIKKHGKFALAKGHIEASETEEVAAVRELLEETGCDVEIVKKLGTFCRRSTEDSGEIVNKHITIFLMNIRRIERTKTEEEPIWVSSNEAINEMLYPEEKEFLLAHLDVLRR